MLAAHSEVVVIHFLQKKLFMIQKNMKKFGYSQLLFVPL